MATRGVAPLRARLFGELDLRLDGRQLAPLPSARTASLLAYLVLHAGVPHARQRIAFLLWPDSTESQARTNLRNALHLLRRAVPALEPFLEVGPRTLCWRPSPQCSVDVADFDAALAEAAGAEAGSDARIVALSRAVDLYAGDLLAACYDEWVVGERERLRDRYGTALRQLTETLAARGRHPEAIAVGRQLLRWDPLNEDHHRLLIGVHDAAGDRAGAVRLFHQCAAVLRQELGVEPASATKKALAGVMRATDVSADEPAPDVRGPGAPLVGRDEEWAELTACWRAVEEGRSHLVMVTGEPGVGKTRLVEELVSWCAHRGSIVATARSYPAEGDLGYGAVISWLRTPDVAAHIRRTAAPADVAELGRLLPELASSTPVAARPLEDAQQRLRLFDTVSRALTGTGRAILLVADDAHWSDLPSLQLVHYLVRAASRRPVLVVVTARKEEVDDRHPLSTLANGLGALDRATEIRLDRLSRDETRELARQLAGSAVDASGADHLHAETEGNPLFIVETIRAGWDGTGMPGPLTRKLQAVIRGRLSRLSGSALHLVGLAATVGRAFTADLVGRAGGMDDLALVRALDELWRRDVIREHDADAYDFTHGKIRDAAYEALSPAARRRNHRLVAEALIAIHGDDPDSVSGQVAVNYEQAGDAEQAVTWYLRAAAQAMRRSAEAEAVSVLERARSLLESLPGPAGAHRELEIVSMLATALVGVEGFSSERMASTQRRAIELASALGVEPSPPLLRSLVMSNLSRDEFEEGRAAARLLLDSATRDRDDGLAMESRYLLGIGAFWAADLEAAREHFEHVVEGFRPEQRAEHLLRFGQDPKPVCLSRLGNTLWFLGRTEAALAAREAALALAREPFHPFTSDVTYVFACLLAVDLEEHDRLLELVESADAVARARGRSPVLEIKDAALRGYADVVQDRPDQGIERIRAAMEACGRRNPVPGFCAALMRLLVGAYALAGEHDAGLASATEALEAGGTRLWEPEVRRLRGEFLAALGHPAREVEAELRQAADAARRQGALGPLGRIELSRKRLQARV